MWKKDGEHGTLMKIPAKGVHDEPGRKTVERITTDLDLSDYDKIIRYCKVADNFADANNPTYFTTGCKVRPWWRYFDDMTVEDDRK